MKLSAVFAPKSIAIVGASSTVGSVGNDLVKNLVQGFTGKVYPVNIKGGELYGLPVFTSLKKIGKKIDLAVIAVPAAIVPQVLKEAGQSSIPAAVVISAGFREAGNPEAEAELVAIAQKYNITLIGPNCLGVINPHLQMNASFAPTMPSAGSIAFLSQSGALGTAILDYAASHAIGFSKFLSMGNKALVNETDVLQYLAQDPQTKVILLYAEQMTDLDSVLQIALKIRKHRHPKPIIVLKSGQTAQGMQAASSHTGALAGNDAFYKALFREAGIIRANSIQELFTYAECFAANPLLKHDRVAVVTNAGGLGVLLTDALVAENLTLAQLSDKTKRSLAKVLPAAASFNNPIDILGDAPAQRYQQSLEIVVTDPAVDAVVVLLTPQSMTQVEATAQAIVKIKKQTKKPIVVNFLGGSKVTKGIDILEKNQVSEVSFPEWAARGLSVLHSFTQWKGYTNKPTVFSDFSTAKLKKIFADKSNFSKDGWMDGEKVLQVLEACGISVVKRVVVTKPADAEEAVEKVGGSAVFKILSPDIQHKSDVGGVMLGIRPSTAAKAYNHIMATVAKNAPSAKLEGIQVTQFITNTQRQELLLGAIHDPKIGTLLGCGSGGIFTEIEKDSSFTLAPASHQELLDTVQRLRRYPILAGARGQKPYHIESVIECMARIGQLLTQQPQISELDINPLFVFEKGTHIETSSKKASSVVVDARLRITL